MIERCARWKRRTPISSSSKRIWWLTADAVTRSSSPACRIDPKRAAASNARTPFSVGSFRTCSPEKLSAILHFNSFEQHRQRPHRSNTKEPLKVAHDLDKGRRDREE